MESIRNIYFGLHIITSYTHLHGILTRYAHHKWLHSRRGVSSCSGVHHYLLANAETVAAPAGGLDIPKEPSNPSCDLPQSAHWLRISRMPAP